MCLKFKSELATQHYEEVSEIVSDMLDEWDKTVMEAFDKDLSVEAVAHMTTNLIQIRCQQFRKVAFEAAQLDIQATATETAVSAELSHVMTPDGTES